MWQDDSQVPFEAPLAIPPVDPDVVSASQLTIPPEPIGPDVIVTTSPPPDPAAPQVQAPFYQAYPPTEGPFYNALPPPEAPFLDQAAPLDRAPPTDQAPYTNRSSCNPIGGPFVTVFSGTLVGRLHRQLFVCPGIHEPCIEFEGEMLTPKEFTYRSDKSKQKDWKGSIRAGQRSLRFMMETKAIEFYNHKDLCSGKCQGRNHGTSNNVKPEPRKIPVPVYPKAAMYTPAPRYAPYQIPVPPVQQPYFPMQAPMPNPMQNMFYYAPPQPSIMCAPPAPIYATPQMYYSTGAGDLYQEGQMTYAVLGGSCGGSPPPMAHPGVFTTERLIGLIDNDPVLFWNEVRNVRLLPDFLQMIGNTVDGLRLSAADPNANLGNIAHNLSRLVDALDLKPYVINRIQKNQTNYYGTMPNGDVGPQGFNYMYGAVPNPYGADLTQSVLYVPNEGQPAINPVVDLATTEYEDPRDRPPPASPTPTPKRRRFVIKHGDSDDEA